MRGPRSELDEETSGVYFDRAVGAFEVGVWSDMESENDV